MRFPIRLVIALAVMSAPACATARPSSTSADQTAPDPTYVRVDNRNFADMTIYVMRGAERIRLGLATGNTVSKFRIPAFLTQVPTTLRFLADPIGSRVTPVSDAIQVEPGDTVTLEIPAN